MLHGRETEQARIDDLITGARAGRSGALVLRGEPGIGKSALLDYAAAQGIPTVRSAGIESEAELPFAALHLLVRPGMELVRQLPPRQRDALEAAFGLGDGTPADRMLIGLAVLTLLAEEAAEGPLLCLIDDAHWLDRATAEALLFAARRLDAEGVVMLFATRPGPDDFPAPGLAELALSGLRPDAAAALLDAGGANLSPTARYRLLTESGGNPLALLELPSVIGAGADGNPLPLTQRLQLAFHGRVARLPAATRTVLLVAAAAGAEDLAPVLRAAASFGAGLADLQPAQDAGLVGTDGQVLTWRHPLLRAAVYQGSPLTERLAAHRALADALDDADAADLRAWHLACAATGPDEQAADALERSAARARRRNGFHGAVAAYDRAAALSVDVPARTRRLVLAAEIATEAGLTEQAARLADRAAAQPVGDTFESRLQLVRAQAEFARGTTGSAHRRLMAAAITARADDPSAAARILSRAVHTAWYLGPTELDEVAEVLATLRLDENDPITPIMRYLTTAVAGRRAIAPGTADSREVDLLTTARQARAAGADSPADLVQLCGSGLVVGQDEQVGELAEDLLGEAREQGRIALLAPLLFFRSEAQLFGGVPGESRVGAEEGVRIAADIGQAHWVSQLSAFLAYLAALRGDEESCRVHAERAVDEEFGGAGSVGASWAHAARAMAALGTGRLEQAHAEFDQLSIEPARHQVVGLRTLVDRIEVAVRLGAFDRAREALERLTDWSEQAGQAWIAALVARGRALLADGASAEAHFAAALTANRPFDEARTRLLYGEWLRRDKRKVDARTQLEQALEVFDRLDAQPWSARARAELGALGVGVDAATGSGALSALTPQESQIVRLAAQGLSNREIAARLFLSHRTVGHHLYKAYPKLGVVSRAELSALDLAP
ncbi:helix-turn-helix transcriptional regulator [Nocardia mangyaensis]|uniref:Helix-turn-helix transcriptional regulator n=1 Tax=Nocardia mangyaensis TaxID=2213200 RepID=A0A1J0W1G8_9NOCA|nr:AAA family ATPase [Nocardia mangyaensis]APE38171.1 helix-turn-helix transcriptional regulator [Nocardia mangyaensis]